MSWRAWQKILTCFLLLFLAVFCFVLVLPTFPIPTFEEVRGAYKSSDIYFYDRHGELLQTVRVDRDRRRIPWIGLEQVPEYVRQAFVAAEDRNFFSHRGVDWGALLVGVFTSFHGGNLRGASTITMQLASMLVPAAKSRGVRRTAVEKVRQMVAAIRFEKLWTKGQILEGYLNLVYLRGELQGLNTAARGLYGKQVHGLNQKEGIILAALVRSPGAKPEAVARRATALAFRLGLNSDEKRLEEEVSQVLNRPPQTIGEASFASHAAVLALRSDSSLTDRGVGEVNLSIDLPLQQFVAETLRRQLLPLHQKNTQDSAALVVDNETGEVLAYVGNSGQEASRRYIDGVQAKRQAGSILKPFLYGLALDRRLLTAASRLEDSAINIETGAGVYRPKNYDQQFHGAVPLRVALASSLNVPAVKVLQLVGVDSFLSLLKDIGVKDLQDGQHYGFALALGAAEVSLWELVQGYRTLARLGSWAPLSLTRFSANGRQEARRLLSPEASYIVSSILSDRESRSLTFGLESAIATSFWTAVKTGTSKEMRDNWCVGYSPSYTVGVWVGNFSGEPMWDVSGVTGAAPAWVEIMNYLHRTLAPTGEARMSIPANLVQRDIELSPGRWGEEWFIQGTEPVEWEQAQGESEAAFPKIIYPTDRLVVAIDPDIPVARQKMRFLAKGAEVDLQFVLDGNELEHVGTYLLWTPIPGSHELLLRSQGGVLLDRVSFEVRGQQQWPELGSAGERAVQLSKELTKTSPQENPL